MLQHIATDGRPSSFIRLSNGTIFAVQGSQLRPISSFGTYIRMGGNADNTSYLPEKALGVFSVGDPI
jgi:hypothetical protein